MIPLYDATGDFRGERTSQVADRLVQNGLAVPIKNRKGFVVSLHLVVADGSSPIRPTAHVGTRYSFQDKLESGGRPWDLKRLSGKRGGTTYAPQGVRGIFLQVITDCLVVEPV